MRAVIVQVLLVWVASCSGREATDVEPLSVAPGDTVHYRAVVLEYEPYQEWTEEGGLGIVVENARIISNYVAQSKDQFDADIMVAPEYGIQSLEMHRTNPQEMLTVTQYVPAPLRIHPCEWDSEDPKFEAVRILSCSAMLNNIYLVVDLAEASPCNEETVSNLPYPAIPDTTYACPSIGYIFYNTQVVFDRDGSIIARYRKQNLFLEPQFHPGNESDSTALFTTDFGVTFSLQVCFDIAWEHPGLSNVENYGVRDVVMSTAWVDSLPFLIAPSVQNGWSRELGINLLVSGYHLPEKGKLGSGIFHGYNDQGQFYTYNTESGNVMLFSEVGTVASVAGVKRPESRKLESLNQKEVIGLLDQEKEFATSRRDHQMYYDDLSNYTQTLLINDAPGETHEAEACHNDGLCCSLTYTTTSNLTYSLVAYSGVVKQGFHDFIYYSQVCSVLWCASEDVNTCTHIDSSPPLPDEFGPFTLTGTFTADHLYPTMFSRSFQLMNNWQYPISASGSSRTMSTTEPIVNLMTAGFFGRWYERDP